MNTQPFSQTRKMIELCCEYLSVRCICLYVITMSRVSFEVNLHFIVCLNVKELFAQSMHHVWSLSDSSRIPTHNHLVNDWAVVWVFICTVQVWMLLCQVGISEWIYTLWWVQILLPSLKLQICHLLWARSSLTFSQTIEWRFNQKLICDMIITYRQMHHTGKYS